MKIKSTITVWEGCDPTVSEAIAQLQERWHPYSRYSDRYPIVRLIQQLIDPAVATYMNSLPARYSGFVSGVGAGMDFSEIIRLVGFDTMVRLQRQLLRHFIKTEDREDSRDQRFVATIESLIGLVWDCACKRPAKSRVRTTRLNGERRQSFCRFCGSLTELAMYADGSDTPKANDLEEELRLSSQYCLDHRPRLPSGTWNLAYRQARWSADQFDLELARLGRQSAKPATPQAKSGNKLIDSYVFHYVAGQCLQPADTAQLRNEARLMVDAKLSDRKKQMLMLQWSGLNQSEIARQLGIGRQAVSKAIAAIPEKFHLKPLKRHGR
ncbi:LuxR family transcriptional regulator [Pseudomonas aeruginosa]|uniref:LuxR family transcriptional regulator n=1 Tax=Pseudomonas aeruginosa TaxID=287 RepID=UPI00192ADE7A|nr:LuxR family transcriptional regulator [Pseudomonas aeruginosa]